MTSLSSSALMPVLDDVQSARIDCYFGRWTWTCTQIV